LQRSHGMVETRRLKRSSTRGILWVRVVEHLHRHDPSSCGAPNTLPHHMTATRGTLTRTLVRVHVHTCIRAHKHTNANTISHAYQCACTCTRDHVHTKIHPFS
jgi:hypothetical protein